MCWLVFYGILFYGLEDRNYVDSFLFRLKVYKLKYKYGFVEWVMDDYSVIGCFLFKKEINIQFFVGFKVYLFIGELGVIDSVFGQSGKFKIYILGGFSFEFKKILIFVFKKWVWVGCGEVIRQEESVEWSEFLQYVVFSLIFKCYVFDIYKCMVQFF